MFYITTSARALKTKGGVFFPYSESSCVGGGWIMFMFFFKLTQLTICSMLHTICCFSFRNSLKDKLWK